MASYAATTHSHQQVQVILADGYYKALSGSALPYITKLCVPVASIRHRSALQSAAHGILFVPRTRLELGKRAFAVTGPASWNNLPDSVRRAPTRDEFKQRLKTHLFRQSYRPSL